MKNIFLLLFLTLGLVSCSLEDDGSNFEIETLPIKEADVPESFVFGRSYDVTVLYDLPNSCYAFYDLYYQYEGTARIVAINALVNNDVACTQELIEKEHTFTVNVNQREDYTFRFWKGVDAGGENIFEEIVVPVTDTTPR